MEMEDEEMEVEMLVFEAREVDLDYEFDAAMYFDFTREESLAEALEAERWFDMAQSYPPSPFVAKLVLREETLLENINGSPESEEARIMETLISEECGIGLLEGTKVDNEDEKMYRRIFSNLQSGHLREVPHRPLELAAELTYYDHTYTGKSKAKAKCAVRPNVPRSSTLMKPTASVLAKQNRPPQVDGSRFQQLFDQKEKSTYGSSAVESQAAKRQKLEGGHSRKVGDAKQQTDFIHKAPKKDGAIDKSSAQSRLRLTIPREPDLETAYRAQQRMRPKNSTEIQHVAVVAQRFRARPLNRKILEAPSLPLPKKSSLKLPEFQEFHLKTLERAMQHASAVSSSSLWHNDSEQVSDKPSMISAAENGKRESRRPSTMDTQKQDVCNASHVFNARPLNASHVFKARPLNKKIFTSKGDIGVFRISKRETTVPMEFNLHTEKRINPPIDLFSKLSLTSELQPNNGYPLQLPRPSFVSIKDSKENTLNNLQTEHKMMIHSAKEKPLIFGGKQTKSSEVGNKLSMRSLGVR